MWHLLIEKLWHRFIGYLWHDCDWLFVAWLLLVMCGTIGIGNLQHDFVLAISGTMKYWQFVVRLLFAFCRHGCWCFFVARLFVVISGEGGSWESGNELHCHIVVGMPFAWEHFTSNMSIGRYDATTPPLQENKRMQHPLGTTNPQTKKQLTNQRMIKQSNIQTDEMIRSKGPRARS